jgi:hypothetical protein
MMATDQSDSTAILNAPSAFAPGQGAEDLSPLEQDLLDEYEKLADNMKKVLRVTKRGSESTNTDGS